MSKKVAVITRGNSDILKVLKDNKVDMDIFEPGSLPEEGLRGYSSFILLGGDQEDPLFLHPSERIFIEQELKKGKKIFAEYCGSIGSVYFENPSTTRFHRLVFSANKAPIKGIDHGDILDDQCGTRIRPHKEFCSADEPVLRYMNFHSHKSYKDIDKSAFDSSDRALWFEKENLLICGFRLSNFVKGRYAPIKKIHALVSYILSWVAEEAICMDRVKPVYSIKGPDKMKALEGNKLKKAIEESTQAALSWLSSSKLIIDEGKGGIYEGYGTEIYPDGGQRFADLIRADCAGEAAMVNFFDYLYSGSKARAVLADNLTSFVYDKMQIKEDGPYKGMVRWSNQAFEACYQDDVARAINGHLLRCIITGERNYLDETKAALDFMIKTTGTDGTRIMRTDICSLSEERIKELAATPGNLASAHYNGYYLGTMLLYYKLTGEESYKELAVKGLTTIMKAYPETVREQSQTEEYCRLILPLSWLYWITREEEHKNWLYKVTEGLQQFKHSSGAYVEWDEGYKATMRNTKGDGECSLLAENGDMVVDLLYSNNWLPMAFIQAYYITGDEMFKKLWEENVKFILGIQLISEDEKLNGAWARGFDVEYMEYFGSPADAGWGPWAMESGWTIGEIAAGLYMGLLEDKIKAVFNS
ncbi:MAG: hypothetical protein ACI33K_12710 [Clostridiaceae bacterium]